MKKDYLITFITQMAVMAAAILVYKIAAARLMGDGFSEYALTRRVVSTIEPLVLVGFGVAIPRYLSASKASFEDWSDGYIVGGALICVSISVLLFGVFMLAENPISRILFGNVKYVYLLKPVSLMIIGTTMHMLCYGYYRGMLKMNRANALQMINLAIMPVLLLMLGMKHVTEYVTFLGCAWISISALFAVDIGRAIQWRKIRIIKCVRDLFLYGIQRVPADFGLAAILSLPVYYVAHTVGVREAGFVAFGVSILRMVASVFAPIGLILLPKVSTLVATGDINKVKHHVKKLLKLTVASTLVGVLVFEIFADNIIDLYLGSSYVHIANLVRLLIPSALPYAVFVSMRSVIDACYFRSINTVSIAISCGLYLFAVLAIVLLKYDYYYVVGMILVPFTSMMLLTLYYVRKAFRRDEAGAAVPVGACSVAALGSEDSQ